VKKCFNLLILFLLLFFIKVEIALSTDILNIERITPYGTSLNLSGNLYVSSTTVGIGTSTPSSTLHVIGNVTITNGLTVSSGIVSLPAGQINNAEISELDWTKLQNYPTGCGVGYAVQAVGDTLTCIEVSGSGGGVSGSGTANRIAKFISSSILGNSGINDSSDDIAITIDANENVGIGTTSPTVKLDVNGTVKYSGWEDLGNIGAPYCLTVWSSKLCAGTSSGNVKCYNGSSWQDLGDTGSNVISLTVWNDKLCEGNTDDHVKCYNGSSWQDLGDMGDNVNSLIVWNNKLCEGNFDKHIKCYNGSSWQDLGDTGSYVQSLTVWNGDLCFHGSNITCYNGSSWQNLSSGVGGFSYAIIVWNDKFCVQGSNASCYDGNSWQDLGYLDGTVRSLTVWNGKLCEGDSHTHVRCYDGISWQNLGDLDNWVYDLTVWNGKLCGTGLSSVKCYTDSDYLDNVWHIQGDDAVYEKGNVRVQDLYASGNIYAKALYEISDERLKDQITPYTATLDALKKLQPVKYVWKFTNETNIGLIANDVKEVIPEIVIQDQDGYYRIDYAKLGVFLINIVKDQQEEIDELRKDFEALEERVEKLEENI